MMRLRNTDFLTIVCVDQGGSVEVRHAAPECRVAVADEPRGGEAARGQGEGPTPTDQVHNQRQGLRDHHTYQQVSHRSYLCSGPQLIEASQTSKSFNYI
jgi:hypothetical protein